MKKLTKTNSDLVRGLFALGSLVALCAVCFSARSAALHAIAWSMLWGSLSALVGGFAMGVAIDEGVGGPVATGLFGGACVAAAIAFYIRILVLLTTSATTGLVIIGWCSVAYTLTKLAMIGHKKFVTRSQRSRTHAW